MNHREYKKKSITEFYTSRENNSNPISCITNGFRYSAIQEDMQVKYISKLMKKSTTEQKIVREKDKYRIFAGKLHVYNTSTDTYNPIERGGYIDIFKHSQRLRNDNAPKGALISSTSTNFFVTNQQSFFNPKLCSRETERQEKSVEALSRISKLPKNFSISRNRGSNKSLCATTDRGIFSSYQISRLQVNCSK